jgi:hypothetical protein
MRRLLVSICVGGIEYQEAERLGLLGYVVSDDTVESYSVTTSDATEQEFLAFCQGLYRKARDKGLVRGVNSSLLAGTIAKHD